MLKVFWRFFVEIDRTRDPYTVDASALANWISEQLQHQSQSRLAKSLGTSPQSVMRWKRQEIQFLYQEHRGQRVTGSELQNLRAELEQKLWEHEELIRQLRVLNQALKTEVEACWADRDALQRRNSDRLSDLEGKGLESLPRSGNKEDSQALD